MKQRTKVILDIMREMFPSNETELIYSNPYQLLLAVALSAQTTDKQVNKVTANLFQYIKQPQDVLDMWLESLKDQIKSIWLYISKANNIYKMAQILTSYDITQKLTQRERDFLADYGHYLPADIEKLIELPGVWTKTAKVFLHVIYHDAFVPVDTHVHRVANRLAITSTTSPEATSKVLESEISTEYKAFAHHSMILFGRYHCKAQRPNCESCPLTQYCVYWRSNFARQVAKR